MARKKYPSPPDTLDPADWWMYCDILQDIGAQPARWRWAKRVGDSLHAEPRLLLLAANGANIPRVVTHAAHACAGNYQGSHYAVRHGTPFPVWVKPRHIHHLRWYEVREWNDAIVAGLDEPTRLADDAFTPDDLTTNKATLALYNYGCDYYRRLKPSTPDYGRVKLRQDFFACHGRVGVAEELDARRKWHV